MTLTLTLSSLNQLLSSYLNENEIFEKIEAKKIDWLKISIKDVKKPKLTITTSITIEKPN